MKNMMKLTAVAAVGLMGLTAFSAANVSDDDPRKGLASGWANGGKAASNMKLVSEAMNPEGFRPAVNPDEDVQTFMRSAFSYANTDLAFYDDKVVMGSYHGVNIYEVNDEGVSTNVLSMVCPGGQGDVSVYGDLMFMSVEQRSGRVDCGTSGVEGGSSEERFLGVRIFDISDLGNPRQVGAVQTCRGSHTHTIVPSKDSDDVVYVYNQGAGGPRQGTELEGCSSGNPDENPETSLYSIDIIKVPLSAPQNAEILSSPRIFADRETGKINGLWMGGKLSDEAQSTAVTNHCHDITVYPEHDLAAGACSGNGILLDISDRENPKRIADMADPNFAYWHAAIFDNAATKVMFTDEWGGGGGPRCRAEDPALWGGNVIADITDEGFVTKGYFKIPNVQSTRENCVAHNGSLIPVPGRDIVVQSWYQGGISIIDMTDSSNPFEIGFFDRGPIHEKEFVMGGYWSAYWHNGRIYGSEIVRGLDVFELTASEHLSEAELAAAKSVWYDEGNPQTQMMFKWEPSADVAQAYLDQLMRGDAIKSKLAKKVAKAIDNWGDGADKKLIKSLHKAAAKSEGRTAARYRALAGTLESA